MKVAGPLLLLALFLSACPPPECLDAPDEVVDLCEAAWEEEEAGEVR